MASNDDTIAITLPAALVPSDRTPVLKLAIVKDKNGKRAISRRLRDANASDPGRIKRVEWEIWGPIGASLESTAGYLGVDFCRDMETRWERRLTSALAETFVTLTGFDPPGTASYFGTSYFGAAYFGSGIGTGSGGGAPDVVVFDEQGENLFAHRGPVSTQVSLIGGIVAVGAVVQDANVRDADHWRGMGRIALGPSVPMQTRTGITATSATYENTVSTSPAGNVYANSVKRGSDRAWYMDAEAGDTQNFAGYTLDAFLTLAFPFQVGDPDLGVNSIGPFGPVTAFGAEDGIYTFTDQGKPVPLSRALQTLHSPLNGSWFADPGWGWNYYLSVAGLRCHDLRGNDNPVGIGERMRGFTGHNGIATAVFATRGELWVVYQTSAGDLYGYRGTFGPQTGGTGQPLMFPWFYAASQACEAIFSSTTPNAGTQNLTIFRGAGTNMTYMTIAANGRDDLASLTYSVSGGTTYLTTLDRDPNLLKVLRLVRGRARNMTSGSSWVLQAAFDANPISPTTATWVTIGTVTSNGAFTLTPVSGGVPLSSIAGRTIKFRWVQTAGGSGASTTPPELEGTTEAEYDERPEEIEEITVAVSLENTGWSDNLIWDLLNDLVSQNTDGPVKIQLPDDLTPGVSTASGGGQKYAMLARVEQRQDTGSETEHVTLTWNVWPQAVALG